ncbi:MAG: DUF3189 family protein [Bacteroidota bacterium]
MKVFYQCYGRSHTSIVAAHIHLGNLPESGTPTVRQITALPQFDAAKRHDFGRPLLMGRDGAGHEVYALGLALAVQAGLGAIYSIFRLNGEAEEPLVVNALKGLGVLARIGGGLSREFGLVSIGRPLVAYGIKQIFPRLVATVDAVKRFLEESAR